MQGLVRKVALSTALLVSCARQRAEESTDARTESAVVRTARGAIASARAELEVEGCLPRPRYLALRRTIAFALPLTRELVPRAAEVIVGPKVVIGETAGSLSALDLAMTTGDCAEERVHAFQIRQALRLIDSELTRRPLHAAAVIRGLSEAAYLLGAEILESTPGTPSDPDAVLADLHGTLRALSDGAAALAADTQRDDPIAPTLAPFARLAALSSSHAIVDRAALVIATGPVGEAVRDMGRALGVEEPTLYRPLHPTARVTALTLPRPLVLPIVERVAIGELLFHDPRLSRGRVRACTSCHDPARAFTDARAVPRSLDPAQPLTRNTPTLLYAPVAAVLHWDGRIRKADTQALNVLHARAEMGLSRDELLAVISADRALAARFVAAFPDGLTEANIGHALAAYESEKLVPASSPLDWLARGDASAWTADMSRGLDLFSGKGRCGRCHVPPTFGGARPPDFTAPVFGVLGVPDKPGGKALDRDPGRYAITRDPLDAHAFRTPTVRNAGATAPYFHHGAFARLEDVLDFYDKGGGRGLGLAVPNQDPDVRPLELTAEERRVVLVFLREALREGT